MGTLRKISPDVRRIVPGFRRLILLLWMVVGGLNSTSAEPPRVLQRDGFWWLAGPDGRPFFSRGVCCVNPGLSRTDYDPQNPAYAYWRQFASLTNWASSTEARLRSWNMTTLGAWSELPIPSENRSAPGLWRTPVLHLGSSAGVPWYDLWDEKVLKRVDDLAREQILHWREHPNLLGYYSDNELGWWNAALFKATLHQPASSGQRQRLVQLLRTRYDHDWKRLLQDFEPEHTEGWADLEQHGVLHLRPGGRGIPVLREFLSLLAHRYYEVMEQTIRRYDSRALILGDRYQSFFYPEVARAAAAHVDVISSNLNAQWDDGTFLRCYLQTLHELTGKPVLVSEYYLAAQENRSGNRNDQGVFPVVATQVERARGAARTLTEASRYPFVVGADWFQWSDEPRHGRTDGENFNFGLVDLEDRPYRQLTEALAAVKTGLGERMVQPRSDARQGIPPAPKDPGGNFEPGQALLRWDRERGWVPAATPFPLADLYVCWDREFLYLGVYSLDIVEDAFYRDRNIPKSARALWTVGINGAPAVEARLGSGREAIVNQPEILVKNLSGWNLNVRNIAFMAVPASRWGAKSLKVGQTIELTCSLSTHGQADRIEWKGTFRLAAGSR